MNISGLAIKKRMMFLKGDDLYYLTYNILVLLKELQCFSSERPFVDHNKLAFLVEFVADKQITSIITRNSTNLNISQSEKHILQSTYADGLMRRHIITRLIFALNKRHIIGLSQGETTSQISLWIIGDTLPEDFFKTDIYDAEIDNILSLKQSFSKIRTMRLDTMLEKLFDRYGVSTWHV